MNSISIESLFVQIENERIVNLDLHFKVYNSEEEWDLNNLFSLSAIRIIFLKIEQNLRKASLSPILSSNKRKRVRVVREKVLSLAS